jgi:hypothetical protein
VLKRQIFAAAENRTPDSPVAQPVAWSLYWATPYVFLTVPKFRVTFKGLGSAPAIGNVFLRQIWLCWSAKGCASRTCACLCDVPPVHGWFSVIDRSFSRLIRSAPVNVGALWLALRVTKGFFSPFHKLYGSTRRGHILTLNSSFANSWNMQLYRHWVWGSHITDSWVVTPHVSEEHIASTFRFRKELHKPEHCTLHTDADLQNYALSVFLTEQVITRFL